MAESRFTSLPAELRIRIYEYALTFDRVSCDSAHDPTRIYPKHSLTQQLALTRVNKQIRAECQQLPFTLNKPIVGTAPWQAYSSISELHDHADAVAQNIASIPSGLISDSTTLSVELCAKAKAMFAYGFASSPINARVTGEWLNVRIFFGKLLRTTPLPNVVLDVTPGNEKYGLHLWCEAGACKPTETDLEARYELRPEIETSGGGSIPGCFVVAASFDCALVQATMERHQDHGRSVCNVAKHGEELLARVVKLELTL